MQATGIGNIDCRNPVAVPAVLIMCCGVVRARDGFFETRVRLLATLAVTRKHVIVTIAYGLKTPGFFLKEPGFDVNGLGWRPRWPETGHVAPAIPCDAPP